MTLSGTMTALGRTLAFAFLGAALSSGVTAGADNLAGGRWIAWAGSFGLRVDLPGGSPYTTGMEPFEAGFWGYIEASGCNEWAVFSWTFGDGGTSAEQNPVHTYPGSRPWPGDYPYPWTVVIASGGQTCARSGRIRMTPLPYRPGNCDGGGAISIGELQRVIQAFLWYLVSC